MLLDYARKSDSRFFAMMKDFVRTYHNQSASTEDFKKIVDKYFGADMDWFFRQWVYGTEIPRVEVIYSLSETPQGAQISGKIIQKDVSSDFRTIIPIVLHKDKGVLSGKLSATGEVTPFRFDLSAKPDSVEINPLDALLVSDFKVTQTGQ
jgi:aminopeptidase N